MRVSAGMDGPAASDPVRYASRARTYSKPHSTISPLCSVPSRTRTVTTGPRPLSRKVRSAAPLIHAPLPCRFQFQNFRPAAGQHQAVRQYRCPLSQTRERTAPHAPHSSGRVPYWDSSFLTRSDRLPAYRFCFTATTTGTPAASRAG